MAKEKIAKYLYLAFENDKVTETNRYYENDEEFLKEYLNVKWYRRMIESEIDNPKAK